MNVLDLLAAISKGFFKFDDLSVFNIELLRYLCSCTTTQKRGKGEWKRGRSNFKRSYLKAQVSSTCVPLAKSQLNE